MKSKKRALLLATSALTAGAAQGAIVYSGLLNITSTWTNDNSGAYGYGRLPENIISNNTGPDFIFGYDTASTKPYVDARYNVFGMTNGVVHILANGNEGLPATAAGTLIDASYASLYPGNAATNNQGMMCENQDGSEVVGDWPDTVASDAYVGIELALGGSTNFGWLHFVDNPTLSNPTLTLADWAYETTPNTGIMTGDSGMLIQNPSTDANGHPAFGGSGIPNYTYGVQSAANLNGPWSDIGTTTVSANGLWAFTDTNQNSPATIFYRLRYPYAVPSQVPPAPPVAVITTLPNVDKGYAVGGRDIGMSVKIGSYLCCFFGDTMMTKANAEGQYWVVNTMYHTTNFDGDLGITGGYNWLTAGKPANQFIPYTAAETEWNATNSNHYVYGIWPNAEFYYNGTHYIMFYKVIEEPGAGAPYIGTGLAIAPADPINGTATRVQSRPGAIGPNGEPEDYLMWDSTGGTPLWGVMCPILGDYVYSYRVDGDNFGITYVSRAQLSGNAFLNPTNWTYWNGSGWASSRAAAAGILTNGGMGTIEWNPCLSNGAGGKGCYLYTYMGWVVNRIYCRTSNDLLHWSAATLEYTVPNVPAGYFPYIARTHKPLEKNNGQTQYITWCMPCTNIPYQDIEMIKAEFP
jgi:Domain of unknown function (DUF4185)